MLDGKVRKILEPALDRIASTMVSLGIGANAVTIIAFLIGMAACVAIIFNWLITGMVLLLMCTAADVFSQVQHQNIARRQTTESYKRHAVRGNEQAQIKKSQELNGLDT